MATHVGECGHSVTKPGVKRCRACWIARGPDGNGRTRVCVECGNPISSGSKKGRCRECDLARWRAPVAPDIPLTYDEASARFDQIIGKVRAAYAGPKRRRPGVTQKVVIASDFHVPFQSAESVARLFAEQGDADLLIVGGDLMDHYSISRFIKYEHCPIETELAGAAALLAKMSETWPRVVVLEGNHDRPRFEKQLRSMLSEEMVKLIEFLAGGNLSALAALIKRYPNVELAQRKVGQHTVGWFHQEGDLLVTHAEKFSKVPGSALRGVEEWFADFERVVGVADWRVVVQAHTHQLAWFPWHAGKLLVESGCLCKTHGYQVQPRISGRPQRQGYITCTQTRGETDLDSVRCHWLDA